MLTEEEKLKASTSTKIFCPCTQRKHYTAVYRNTLQRSRTAITACWGVGANDEE